jgi:guanylate kinase
MRQLMAQFPEDYHQVVSHITRPPRVNNGIPEQNGREYHFIDKKTGLHMLAAGGFIEANEYHGNLYGTSVAEVQLAHDEGKIAINDIEVQGVADYVKLASTIKPVFILPPSYKVWQQRFKVRYGNDEALYRQEWPGRMRIAQRELHDALQNKYFYLVINNNLDETVAQINNIAQHATKPTRSREAIELVHNLLANLQKDGALT